MRRLLLTLPVLLAGAVLLAGPANGGTDNRPTVKVLVAHNSFKPDYPTPGHPSAPIQLTRRCPRGMKAISVMLDPSEGALLYGAQVSGRTGIATVRYPPELNTYGFGPYPYLTVQFVCLEAS